jgi:hypothetical protein
MAGMARAGHLPCLDRGEIRVADVRQPDQAAGKAREMPRFLALPGFRYFVTGFPRIPLHCSARGRGRLDQGAPMAMPDIPKTAAEYRAALEALPINARPPSTYLGFGSARASTGTRVVTITTAARNCRTLA